MKAIARLSLAAAAVTAAVAFDMPQSFAYGDAPWCAVVSLGPGEVHWDCSYRTVEECQPNVIAGNRGFCNLNPYWRGPYASSAPSHRRGKKRRAY